MALAFLMPFVLVVVMTPLIRRLAVRIGAVDVPDDPRKIHEEPRPLLGGCAVFVAFFVGLFIIFFSDALLRGVSGKRLLGVFLASLVLMIGGFLDDRFRLRPVQQMVWPLLAVIVVIAAGIGIRGFRNPFGGVIELDQVEWILFWFRGWPYRLTLFADVFTLLWLSGMMYTTKLLDGLDGLVPGILVIGAVVVAIAAMMSPVPQPAVATLALLAAGAFAGFLIFNWHPAKIFLGEGGALFAGFLLGVLAILSVSKVAVTLLVVGIPALDVAWVIVRRIFREKRSPFVGDAKHLHFRLLAAGLSHRRAVVFLWIVSAAFGASGLFLEAFGKLVAIGFLFGTMLVLALALVIHTKRVARG